MNNLRLRNPRLSKSGIEYLDYMWGIFSGCHNWANGICGDGKDFNCWARSLATRFPNIYPNGFEPTYYPAALDSPKSLKKPSRIAVGWVGDVIGYGVEYKEQIYSTIRDCPQHTFLFLTKNSENLLSWSPLPPNAWVGVSVTNQEMHNRAIACLAGIEASVKFISYEPLLEHISIKPPYALDGINWVVVGQATPIKKATMPEKIWVDEIVFACDKARIPFFIKNNLKPLLAKDGYVRQEFPERRD